MPSASNAMRIALGVALIPVVAAIAFAVFVREKPREPAAYAPAPPGAAPGRYPADPAGCASCHPEEHGQWLDSRHAVAWTDPHLEAFAVLSLGIEDCARCHAPAPVFQTGIELEPRSRPAGRETGVDCLSCHAGRAGLVGTGANPTAPCLPVRDKALSSSDSCACCHRTIGQDWKQSAAAAQGRQCQDCHMADISGRKTHAMRGARSKELLESAFGMDVAAEMGVIRVLVENTGAGHNFPGERHFRSLLLSVLWLDSAGDGIEEDRRMIKEVNPIRQARPDAMIKAGARERFDFPACAAARSARVRLVYKYFPSDLDSEAIVLRENMVDLRSAD